MSFKNKNVGFTLIELLVVIAIIGILSAVVLASLNEARSRARIAAAQAEMNTIYKAADIARINTGKALKDITGSSCSRCVCTNNTDDLRNIPVNTTATSCYGRQLLTLRNINDASGGILEGFVSNPENIRDPWGSPYLIDENENEYPDNPCRRDYLTSVGPDGRWAGSSDNLTLHFPFGAQPCAGL